MPRKDFFLISGIFLSACAFYLIWSLVVTEPGFPLDDSWIHQVFARNLITGHGFSFIPDRPFSGVTAPLWTLLLAPFWPMFGPVGSGMLWGVLLGFAAILAIYKLTELFTGERRLALLTSLLWAVTWVLVWGALSGMEVGLYSALSLWGLYFYFKAGAFDDYRNYLAYGLFGLAFLSRPECALLLVASAIRDAAIWFRSPDKSLGPLLWRVMPVAILLIPYFAFNYSTTGSIFPQTFAAKERGRGLISGIMQGDFKRIITALSILPYYYAQDLAMNFFALNPLLLVASVAGMLKFASVEDEARPKRLMIVLLFLLYVPFMGILAPVISSTFQRMRTIGNIVPLFIMLGTAGLFWSKARIRRGYIKPILVIALLLGLFGITLTFAAGLIVDLLGPLLLHDISRASDLVQHDHLASYVRESGLSSLFMALALLGGLALCAGWTREKLSSVKIAVVLTMIVSGYSVGMLAGNARIYANDVKNINDMDVAVGLYLREIAEPGQSVAVNDIGAIGYFSGLEIFDLKGLVSPEITNPMITHDSLAFEYMREHKRVDYMAIFPVWFNYIPTRTDIFEPIKRIGVDWNTTLAGDTTVVYKAAWPPLPAKAVDYTD